MRILLALLLVGCAQPQPTVIDQMKQRQAEYERHMDQIQHQKEDSTSRYYATCAQHPEWKCPPLTVSPATQKPTICLQTVDGVSVCP